MSQYRTCLLLGLAVLLLSGRSVIAQNSLDLEEADARDAAYNFMSNAEDRFDCDFEEKSMSELGSDQYLFEVNANGEECDEAMTYLVNSADREGKLIFRHTGSAIKQSDEQLFIPPQILIHEVNPELEGDEQGEINDNPSDPQAG